VRCRDGFHRVYLPMRWNCYSRRGFPCPLSTVLFVVRTRPLSCCFRSHRAQDGLRVVWRGCFAIYSCLVLRYRIRKVVARSLPISLILPRNILSCDLSLHEASPHETFLPTYNSCIRARSGLYARSENLLSAVAMLRTELTSGRCMCVCSHGGRDMIEREPSPA